MRIRTLLNLFFLLFFLPASPLLSFGLAKPKPKKELAVTRRSLLKNDIKEATSSPSKEPESIAWITEWEKPQESYLPPFEELKVYFPPPSEEQDEYRLKVGDSFILSMYGDEKTRRQVVVDPSGMVSYLYAEKIEVLGKTIGEMRKMIEENLRQYFRFATLSITPIKFNSEFYIVSGQLREPGKQPIIGNPTLLTALCDARGFPVIDYRDQVWDMCDLEKSFIARGGEYLPIDFVQLVREGDLRQNIALQAGDFIHVPSRVIKQVFVLGEVAIPKAVDYFQEMSLVEALAAAGDLTDRADFRIVILRGSLCRPIHFLVDYHRIVNGEYPDFPLREGDIVYAPPRKLYLLREVVRAAISAFVYTMAYETGVEWFVRSTPAARPFLAPGTLLPIQTAVPTPVSTTAKP